MGVNWPTGPYSQRAIKNLDSFFSRFNRSESMSNESSEILSVAERKANVARWLAYWKGRGTKTPEEWADRLASLAEGMGAKLPGRCWTYFKDHMAAAVAEAAKERTEQLEALLNEKLNEDSSWAACTEQNECSCWACRAHTVLDKQGENHG